MRLTLSAAETGHLVLATVHSANCAEALQRVGRLPRRKSRATCGAIGRLPHRGHFPAFAIPAQFEYLRARVRSPHGHLPDQKLHPQTGDFFKIISSVENRGGTWDVVLSTLSRVAGQADANFHVAPARAGPRGEAPAPAPAMEMPPRRDAAGFGRHFGQSRRRRKDSRIEIEPTEIFEKILKRPD